MQINDIQHFDIAKTFTLVNNMNMLNMKAKHTCGY